MVVVWDGVSGSLYLWLMFELSLMPFHQTR
jgi:hypothetical protein